MFFLHLQSRIIAPLLSNQFTNCSLYTQTGAYPCGLMHSNKWIALLAVYGQSPLQQYEITHYGVTEKLEKWDNRPLISTSLRTLLSLVHQIEIHTVFKWQVLKAWNEKINKTK